MPFVLALDQSTSATKALLYSDAGELIDKASLDHKQHYPQPGYVEHDANEIWFNVLTVVAQLKQKQPAAFGDLLCLSITNQRETVVVFDRKTGEPLGPALVWQDGRSAGICRELIDAGHNQAVADRTGLKIDVYFSAGKLAWLIRNKPDIAAKLNDGSAVIGTIDTYLIHRLTDGRVFATDSTNASRTLLFNIRTLQWDETLCGLFGVPANALAEVRDATGRFGETTLGGQLDKPLPICGVIGDSQASLFAHRCFAPGQAKVTLGTGSSVLQNLGSDFKPGGAAALTTIAWTHQGRPTYSYEGVISYSAATIAWLKDQLKLLSDPAETEAAAAAVPDNGGVYLVPAFAGLSAPYWSPDARAAIVGLSSHSNRNHVLRAALESIGYQIRDVLDAMRAESGVTLQTLNADGGAARNAFLIQFIADITGLDVAVAPIAECSPLGAVLAGLVGMGTKTMNDLARASQAKPPVLPVMPRDAADRLYAGWQRAVRQTLTV
ncbi:MAG: glycerol kinase GlpK [Tepidisphaeraceae bacterium]